MAQLPCEDMPCGIGRQWWESSAACRTCGVACRLEELEMAQVAEFLAEMEEALEAMGEALEVEEETAKPLARR